MTTELPVGAHLSVPIRLADGRLYGTLCCFSTVPDHSLTERDLAVMRIFADLAAVQVDRDHERERRQAELASRIRRVIDGDGLSVEFQPIVNLTSGRPEGFEALARFSPGPQRGPDRWFADAALVGLGAELEAAAVREALRGFHRLPDHAYLAVNVSPSTVMAGCLDALLGEVPAERLVLEITEHHVVDSYEGLAESFQRLRRRGVRVAVDDAGAGYASFRHILRLSPDIIKLDMTLTRDIDRDPARRALASALVAFARGTASSIVAEGVETEAELTTLAALGITTAQGYYLGRPGPLWAVAGICRELVRRKRFPVY